MNRGSSFGIYLFAALLALILSCSIAVSSFSISDTDPSTYVIIPMLMLILFALFMVKDSALEAATDRKSLIIGSLTFIAFVAIVLDLRAHLGPLFFSYRIDMLLLPFVISALAIIIFGVKKLNRFIPISIYSLFASPLLLLPIIDANLGFASINTAGIYGIAKVFIPSLQYSAPITLKTAASVIGIGNSCIGIGALIGLVMFLIPLAYFYDGKLKDKVIWIVSGLAILIVINFIRMLSIVILWFYYGPNQNTLDFHAIIGQIIFYAVIVFMLVFSGRFGLSYPKFAPRKKTVNYSVLTIIVAVVLSAFYFIITLSYLNAQIIPPQTLVKSLNLSSASASQLYNEYVTFNGISFSTLGNNNMSVAYYLQSNSSSGYATVVLFADRNATIERGVLYNTTIAGWREYLHNGTVSYVYLFISPPGYMYYSTIPFGSTESVILDEFVLIPKEKGPQLNCISAYDEFYNLVSNIAALNPNTFNANMDQGYCIAATLIR